MKEFVLIYIIPIQQLLWNKQDACSRLAFMDMSIQVVDRSLLESKPAYRDRIL
jgi:hypothetical protein